VDISLINYGREQDHPELLKTLALEKIDHCSNSVHIYTDASKTTTNKTSAAFCIPELNIQHSVRLSDNITIFAAELFAIKLVSCWLSATQIKTSAYSSIRTAACKL